MAHRQPNRQESQSRPGPAAFSAARALRLAADLMMLALLCSPMMAPAQDLDDRPNPLPRPLMDGQAGPSGDGRQDLTAPERLMNELQRRFEDPLGGIVINRSVTVLGNDFYQYFSRYWAGKGGDRFTLAVYERPSARFGSEVWIQYRRERMFHIFLPPVRSAARQIARQAADIVFENVANSVVEHMMARSPDLAADEL